MGKDHVQFFILERERNATFFYNDTYEDNICVDHILRYGKPYTLPPESLQSLQEDVRKLNHYRSQHDSYVEIICINPPRFTPALIKREVAEIKKKETEKKKKNKARAKKAAKTRMANKAKEKKLLKSIQNTHPEIFNQ